MVGHSENINVLCLSPDGSLLYSGSADRTVRKWDTANGEVR